MSNEDRVDRAIDDSIKRQYAPPGLDALVVEVRKQAKKRAQPWWWGRRAAAAAVLVGVLFGWSVWPDDDADPEELPTHQQAQLVIEEVPVSEAGSPLGCGMVSDWSAAASKHQKDPSQGPLGVCSNATFGSVTKKTLGCSMVIDAACRPSIPIPDKDKPKMLSFTVRRGEDVVIVYLLLRSADAVPTMPARNLRCWRRAIGPVVAYEVSKLKEPYVLPGLSVPE